MTVVVPAAHEQVEDDAARRAARFDAGTYQVRWEGGEVSALETARRH